MLHTCLTFQLVEVGTQSEYKNTITRSCVAYQCSSRHSKESKREGITFHLIPRDKHRRRIWLHSMRLKNYSPTKQITRVRTKAGKLNCGVNFVV